MRSRINSTAATAIPAIAPVESAFLWIVGLVMPAAVGKVIGVDEVGELIGDVGDPVDDGLCDSAVLEVLVSEGEVRI